MFIGLKEHEKRARVHFIPALKDEVFVTLRAPEVIKDIVKDVFGEDLSSYTLTRRKLGN